MTASSNRHVLRGEVERMERLVASRLAAVDEAVELTKKPERSPLDPHGLREGPERMLARRLDRLSRAQTRLSFWRDKEAMARAVDTAAGL